MSTWENTLNLARFVIKNIPHGNQDTPVQTCNAIGLWEYHLNVEPAINCWLHSIFFHELLLSVGINNRFISCMPADTTDIDNHVVNVVWFPEEKKWAMIDTDMGFYATNQKGLPLSLEEMRWNKTYDVRMKYCSIKEEKPTVLIIHIIYPISILVCMLGKFRLRCRSRQSLLVQSSYTSHSYRLSRL